MKEPERNWTRLIQFLLSGTGGKAGAEDTVLDISCEYWMLDVSANKILRPEEIWI